MVETVFQTTCPLRELEAVVMRRAAKFPQKDQKRFLLWVLIIGLIYKRTGRVVDVSGIEYDSTGQHALADRAACAAARKCFLDINDQLDRIAAGDKKQRKGQTRWFFIWLLAEVARRL